MTKRSLPHLEDLTLPWRTDRPGLEAVIPLPNGPPSETVAFDILVQFTTEVEARHQQKDFARSVIEPRRRSRLGGSPSHVPDTISGAAVTGWLEGAWQAEADMASGIPNVRRWKRQSISGS